MTASVGEYADEYTAQPEAIDDELAALKEQWGTVYTITGEVDGKTERMYLRKPDFNARRAALAAIFAAKDPSGIDAQIDSGIIILGMCFIGGYDLNTNDDTRLEASLQAAKMVEMNGTLALKKN
ncbi:hypothetical protein [Hymenobacter terrenus]|uniref:hypothetical protein n=1 Tax=Hymenobacter terrenus TaxID=1629124 RepID=UPI00061994F0|nr:hypothetical protein [Hymenobacter terrenus]